MTFPILGANSAVGGYAIDNSLRFNDNDSAYLSRTFSTGDRKTFTFSFWFKRGNIGGNQTIFSNQVDLFRIESDNLKFVFNGASSGYYYFNDVFFRDVSAWYHITLTIDTTDATGADRLKLYVNGERLTPSASSAPSQNYDTNINNAQVQVIGKRQSNADRYLDGYLSEFVFIDGTALTPTSFAEADEDSGIWKPIDVSGLDFSGVNSFYLDFENSGSLGADQSGNGNDFTPTNLASTDQTTDTPTNNFATMNAVSQGTLATLSEGNLKYTNPSVNSGDLIRVSTQAFSTGKWYAEFYRVGGNLIVGIQKSDYDNLNKRLGEDAEGYGFFRDGRKVNNNIFTSYGSEWGVGDVVGIAYDADLGTLAFYVNGVSQGNAFTGLSGEFVFATGNNSTVETNGIFNFGQDSSFAGNETRQNNSDANGIGDFYYAPPSGYLALCTQNLATELSPTIDDGSQYFSSTLYTGDGTTSNAITGVGFQGDFAWFKARSSAYSHMLIDSTRGGGARLNSDANYAESTGSDRIQSFDSDGYTISTNTAMNNNGTSFVVWSWLANAGSTSSNTSGSITSTVQANTTAGFSIVTYTGTGSAGTVGHGLGSTVAMVITKSRDSASSWQIYHKDLGKDKTMQLEQTASTSTISNYWGTSTPNSTVFGVIGGGYNNNLSGQATIAYCFAEIEGYSKFGSYTGNGSSDGTFVYTGFRPAFVLIKRTSNTQNWFLQDNKRNSNFNPNKKTLFPNSSSAEDGAIPVDHLSNGFKTRSTDTVTNNSGDTYIYMAFAENPFVSSTGIPVTAR